MREFTESRLVFRFEDGWEVEQWDTQPVYRDADGFGALKGTAACDFVGYHESDAVYLIEVKNFTGDHHGNRDRVAQMGIVEETECKVRDTLAGVLWAHGRRFDVAPLASILRHVAAKLLRLRDGDHRPRIVLWLEDRPSPSPASLSALTGELRRHLLREFGIGNVLVTSLAAYKHSVPGLSVRSAP